MTEKVKIPFEIADAINYLKSESYSKSDIIRTALRANWCNEPEENDVNIEVLNGMDAEKLVLAVHGHCEVEPTYKVGDWVVYSDEFYEVYQVVPGGMKVHIKNSKGSTIAYMPIQNIRHATPEEIKAEKERRVWAKLGRETKQFRVGDIVINKSTIAPCVIGRTCYPSDGFIDSRTAERWYEEGKVSGIHPAESFVSFEEGESDD